MGGYRSIRSDLADPSIQSPRAGMSCATCISPIFVKRQVWRLRSIRDRMNSSSNSGTTIDMPSSRSTMVVHPI
ncbi:MAG: hypothetical protein CMI67_08895, partial [Pelagibaca sp.]|nr:hypothetical protein [Pelagibaca sp.]